MLQLNKIYWEMTFIKLSNILSHSQRYIYIEPNLLTGIKIAGRNINNLRYSDDTTLMAENEEELKSLLMKWKRRVKKLA